MLNQYRLPLVFDPARLQQDLALVRADEWVAHFNKQDYDGAWTGVSLRGVAGAATRIYPAPGASPESFVDTPVLARCSYLAEVLRQFHCPLRAVRLLRLCAGAIIREHRDDGLGLADGEVRIHVPIATNPNVAFFVNGERLTMNPGETWYIDFSLPHRVSNLGETDRVHLVIDCTVNDWLRGLLPPDAEVPDAVPAEAPSSPEALHHFRALVEQDEVLQEELREILDPGLFVSRVVRLGESRDCRFASADVEAALRDAKRAWLERRLTW